MTATSLPLVPDLQAALAQAVEGEVRWDRLSRALYSTDASVYQIVPLGVVLPRTEDDILAVLGICTQHRIPLTARGGGTSQAGQAIGSGVILDCSRHFDQILEINAGERWARVRPGCVLDDLNRAAAAHGLFFAPDISTSDRATNGGMIANNSSGTRSLIYGKTIDHVLELRVALADGSVLQLGPTNPEELATKYARPGREGECYRTVSRLARQYAAEIGRRYPKLLRRVGGYNLDLFVPDRVPVPREAEVTPIRGGPFNLAHLLVGSEGTLAVTLEAKLRLVELPRARALLVVQFEDLLDALAATPGILQHGPSAVEVIDKVVLDSTKLNSEAARLREFLQGDPSAILIIEFQGDDAGELQARLAKLEAELRERRIGHHCHRAVDAASQARIWKLRRLSLGLSMAEKGDAKAISFVEDTAVDPARLRDYIAEFLALIARHGTRAGVYAHASVGCLHVRPVIDLKTEHGVEQFESLAADVADLVLKYGGALSGEHGDGLVRSPFQEKMFGPALVSAFREIKRAFDPLGILNPGKIVDSAPLTANLRFGPRYVTPEVPTTFDFTAEGGIVRAAELCAGVGECRRRRGGTMCPSYRATCDEQHSTRGRANALRMALTGQLGFEGLTTPELHDVLDLCLECKACKSECPTNVDMARLKAEFMDQYYRKNGLPRRSRLFGNVARLGAWGCRFAPFSNWVMRNPLSRRLGEWLFRIDHRRVPPAFAAQTFHQRLARAGLFLDNSRTAASVLLFPDTFIEHHEPELGLAVVRLLRRLGIVPQIGIGGSANGNHLRCCGRPMISNGMLAAAVEHARHNVEMLYPWAAENMPIIACEPSCILTIKDDYPALLHGELRKKAQTVATACRTLEEYLDSTLSRDQNALNLAGGEPKTILVHTHCHQRSLSGAEPIHRLLRRIPGADVREIDAGCCGLAGSFGYEKEHYEISRLAGEHMLFPTLRAAPSDTVVVATGFSCRMQIEHFTAIKAVAPVMLLSEKSKDLDNR
jgi:FAD/FMN-containing dehydrogenase/Fe-S oxidoreductase